MTEDDRVASSYLSPALLDAIAAERRYQDQKYGSVEENPHTIVEWVMIMRAELAEADRAWLKEGIPASLCEILQAVSVGVACLTQHGAVGRGDLDEAGEKP
jgi:hypothetical protein